MKKTVSMIAAILLTASVAMAGSVSAFAEEEPISTTTMLMESIERNSETDETTADMPLYTGTIEETTTVAETTTTALETTTLSGSTAAAKMSQQDAVDKALRDANTDQYNVFSVVDATYDDANGYWIVNLQRVEGTKRLVYHVSDTVFEKIDEEAVNNMTKEEAEKKALDDANKDGSNFKVESSSLDEANGYWVVTLHRVDGNKVVMYYVYADKLERYEETADGTTVVTGTTTKTAATTKAATTTKKADDKSASPKTGDAFPVIPVAGVAVAAAAGALVLAKKKN